MKRSRRYRLSVLLIAFSLGIVHSASLAGPIAVSSFDTDDDGWKVVTTLGYVGSPTWTGSGGNPGGFIYGVDPDVGAWGFAAPSKFLGDVSDAYGQSFSFDIAAYQAPEQSTSWVAISGAGYEFVCPFDTPGTIYPAWHPRTVWMSETAGWFDPDTLLAPTQSEMLAVLSSLDALVIDSEFVEGFGSDVSGLDNVNLMPEPMTVALLAAGLLPLLRRRKR